MRSEGATTRPAASSGGDPTYRWSQASDERLARLLDQRRDQLRMLRHLLDDAADAEDVLQQCYIRALESLGTLRDQERLTAWFDRVVRNAAWDWIRRHRAEARALAVLSREVPEARPFPAGAHSACRCATQLLGVLPAPYADVLRRVYLREIPIEVVARRLRTTPNNVRVRLHRERAALREQLIATCERCPDRELECRAAGGVSLLRTLDEPQAEQASYEKAERLGVHGATLRQQGGGQ